MTRTRDGRPGVVVVGAGVAGAGVADALRDRAVDVTVLERASAPGGRTATERRGSCVYDVGANYVTDDDERVAARVRDLDRGDLVDVASPVWTFDAGGTIEPGDEDRADDRRWTFADGLGTLPRRLLERAGAAVRTDATAVALERAAGDGTGEIAADEADGATAARWTVRTENGGTVGPADAVVLTPPAPRTASILERSPVDDERFERVADAMRSIPFRTVHSFALHYPFALERPYYALVNTDREHAIGWVAREGEKRGHVPADETLLIAQMAPDWSVANRDRSLEAAARAAAERVATLLGDDRLADPDWVDGRRFRRAIPDGGLEDATALESRGVFLAGDWVVGSGRVHAALANGLSVGDRLRETFAP